VEPASAGMTSAYYWDVFGPGDAAPDNWILKISPYDGLLRGVVRGPFGQPLPGARVALDGYGSLSETTAGADGGYEVPLCAFLPARLLVLADGYAAGHVQSELHSGEQTLDVVLEPEKRVHGRVLDVEGAPVESALVSTRFPLERGGARTDADG